MSNKNRNKGQNVGNTYNVIPDRSPDGNARPFPSRSQTSLDRASRRRSYDERKTLSNSSRLNNHPSDHSRGMALSKKTLSIVTNLQDHKKSKESPSGQPSATKENEEDELIKAEYASSLKRGQSLPNSRSSGHDYYIKLLLLGNSGVGKTSLLLRYSEDNFSTNLISTAGVDFKVKHFDVSGKRVKCQIWDTAGQEKFHVITRAYYRGSHGIVLVFDVTDEKSFREVKTWMESIQQHAESRVEKILVGNKVDVREKRVVDKTSALSIAKQYGMKYYETSAKDGTNVVETFTSFASDIVLRDDNIPATTKQQSNIKLVESNTTKPKKIFSCTVL